MIYIFWTCAHKEEAKQIIDQLLDLRLIACASMLPQTESIYRWKGNIERANETKVILKTQERCFDAISDLIRKKGSYEVPEISLIHVTKANPEYVRWVLRETEG